ncbi:DUF6520 family protein [Flavobacterium sp. 102]|uniref:DUF6520 family protein n=1 Tax=Flavobacterium sp. 102 TaxID=2135623 RepID=UPI000EAB6078|nr:DUF6520 family protein [Flavobacterium sp. 102]RKS03052.1 hypothetical protein C8C84_2793 [Flavobacterium sp. 102]
MKTRFFKLFMLPIAAFTLASAAAVGTDSSEESKATTTMTAYIHNPNVWDCDPVPVSCRVGSGETCLYGSLEAFEKDSENACIIQLEKVE